MNLWIRSQNKEKLTPINESIYITYGVDGIWRIRCGVELGHYTTKERALEVLDEIVNILSSATLQRSSYEQSLIGTTAFIYEMPQD